MKKSILQRLPPTYCTFVCVCVCVRWKVAVVELSALPPYASPMLECCGKILSSGPRQLVSGSFHTTRGPERYLNNDVKSWFLFHVFFSFILSWETSIAITWLLLHWSPLPPVCYWYEVRFKQGVWLIVIVCYDQIWITVTFFIYFTIFLISENKEKNKNVIAISSWIEWI